MAKNKKTRGHYCFVCDTVMANEKFSGKGHANHICKKCSKLPVEARNEKKAINRINSLYQYTFLSKVKRQMLNKYSSHNSEKVRLTAKEVLDHFTAMQMERKVAEELEEEMQSEYFGDVYLGDGFDDDSDFLYGEYEEESYEDGDCELLF